MRGSGAITKDNFFTKEVLICMVSSKHWFTQHLLFHRPVDYLPPRPLPSFFFSSGQQINLNSQLLESLSCFCEDLYMRN